ncbi:MAG: glycerol-3-phosphate responsive antiterminator [Eubacterium sp.]
MITHKQLEVFCSYPVIAAVRTPEDFEKALASKVNVFFMVGGDFFKAKEQIKKLKDKGCLLLLHMDLIEGIGRDHGGICFAVEHGGIDGIISTKSQMIKIAAKDQMRT